jgi:hypothetical protein
MDIIVPARHFSNVPGADICATLRGPQGQAGLEGAPASGLLGPFTLWPSPHPLLEVFISLAGLDSLKPNRYVLE